MLRAELDTPLTAAPPVIAVPPLPVPQPGTHDTVLQLQAQVRQQRARCVSCAEGGWMRSRRAWRTRLHSSTKCSWSFPRCKVGAGCSCPACPAPAHPALPSRPPPPPLPCAVEFLALKAKPGVVPGDAPDVAASDTAKMSMDYADLGEELQVAPLSRALILFYGLDSLQTSRLERAHMQIPCEQVVQEFDAATRQPSPANKAPRACSKRLDGNRHAPGPHPSRRDAPR